MKLRFYFFWIFFVVAGFCCIQARDTIIDALQNNSSASQGVINIDSDPEITALLGDPGANAGKNPDDFEIVKMNGFRIQVFMGSDPKRAKSEAFSKQNLIKEKFSETQTYLTYDAPNWKLLAGDFVTRDEAAVFKQILQKEFPEFGKEMYIVTDKINVTLEK